MAKARPLGCDPAIHRAIAADPERLAREARPAGIQRTPPGEPDLELHNCLICGSTFSVESEEVPHV